MIAIRWLRQLFERGKPTSETAVASEIVDAFAEEQQRIKSAGAVNNEHYTDFVEQVKLLKREKRHDEAIELLNQLVDATEAESRAAGAGGGWLLVLRAAGHHLPQRTSYADEVKSAAYKRQPKAPGAGPSKLTARLDKGSSIVGC